VQFSFKKIASFKKEAAQIWENRLTDGKKRSKIQYRAMHTYAVFKAFGKNSEPLSVKRQRTYF
jgi:hypothetical protein